MKVYQRIAQTLLAIENCRRSYIKSHTDDGAEHWLEVIEMHKATLATIMRDAPSGSGFDSGTTLLDSVSSRDHLVFETAFHHMDDSGYTGWSRHCVHVSADLAFGHTLRVTGRDRKGIKDFIAEVFGEWLDREVSA